MIEQASLYYGKAMEMAKKAGNDHILSSSVCRLSECYVKMGRGEEAMDLHKSLCDKIGKERMDPDAIIEFAEIMFLDNSMIPHALTILEDHLETIASSWENHNQCRAYQMIAKVYRKNNDFAK